MPAFTGHRGGYGLSRKLRLRDVPALAAGRLKAGQQRVRICFANACHCRAKIRPAALALSCSQDANSMPARANTQNVRGSWPGQHL